MQGDDRILLGDEPPCALHGRESLIPMARFSVITLLSLGALGLLSGCAATQSPSPSGNADLRRLVMETRREVEELRKDQERLRGVVEYLQYSAGTARAGGTGAPAPMPPTPPAVSAAPPMFPPQDTASVAPVPVQPESPPAASVTGAVVPPDAGPIPAVPAPPNAPVNDPIIASVTGAGTGSVTDPLASATEVPNVPQELRGSGYDDGVRFFVEGQYEDAIQYFRNFVHSDSTSGYADDAQYWIGESYLRKGMYSNAIKEFNQVVLRYGSGDRAAPALLKLAQVFSKIGDQVDARLSLQKLVNRYPGTPEATKAYGMLQQMGG